MSVALFSLCLMVVSQGCGAFRVFNRDNTTLNAHPVTITPCGWKLEDKFAGTTKDELTGKPYFKHTCGETVVAIKDEELIVNGKSYGKLAKPTDAVKFDNGRVFVNGNEVQAIATGAVAERKN
jgi:hypothetical protein